MNPRLTFRRLSWKWSLPGLVLVALLAAFFNPPDPGVTSGEFEYVQRVVDGDTLLLGTGERVRLLGINTPETVHPKKAVEAFGKEASAFTKRMAEGKLERLELDPVASGHNDGLTYSYKTACISTRRLSAKVLVRGEQYSAIEYQNESRRLESEAREQRRGLWASH